MIGSKRIFVLDQHVSLRPLHDMNVNLSFINKVNMELAGIG